MTNFDVRAKIATGLNRLERRLRRKEHDRAALQMMRLWRRIRKKHSSITIADFARLRDDTVPREFDDYWDDPVYQETLYLLFRAGAQPMFLGDIGKPRKSKMRKRRNTSAAKLSGKQRTSKRSDKARKVKS